MRKIKFRAWDKVGKKMFYIDKKHHLEIYIGCWIIGKGLRDIETVDETGILMQYTGLKDKKGTEIYEGDILEWRTKDIDNTIIKERYTVEFIDGCFCTRCTKKEFRNSFDSFIEDKDDIRKKMIVIGNIYEDKDLLKNI